MTADENAVINFNYKGDYNEDVEETYDGYPSKYVSTKPCSMFCGRRMEAHHRNIPRIILQSLLLLGQAADGT